MTHQKFAWPSLASILALQSQNKGWPGLDGTVLPSLFFFAIHYETCPKSYRQYK